MDFKIMNENQFSIFKNKKIIITGDTGFKGSWLSLWLANMGANVLGISLEPKQKNDHYNILNLENIIQHKTLNICDYNS
jgi:CDP-glucose 4,6-dehydratase